MGINLDKAKARLEALKDPKKAQTKNQEVRKDVWGPKAKEGETSEYTVRIVPTSDNDPLKDVSFHYLEGQAPVVCPKANFGEKCPICDFASKLWKQGSEDDDNSKKNMAKALFVKKRYYAPVIVREELFYEDESGTQTPHTPRWWGFGAQIYEQLLQMALNPKIGDPSDVDNGHDFSLTYKRPGKRDSERFPKTSLMTLGKGQLSDNDKMSSFWIKSVPEIHDVFPRQSTKQVQSVLDKYLSPEPDQNNLGTEYNSAAPEESVQSKLDAAIAEIDNEME